MQVIWCLHDMHVLPLDCEEALSNQIPKQPSMLTVTCVECFVCKQEYAVSQV